MLCDRMLWLIPSAAEIQYFVRIIFLIWSNTGKLWPVILVTCRCFRGITVQSPLQLPEIDRFAEQPYVNNFWRCSGFIREDVNARRTVQNVMAEQTVSVVNLLAFVRISYTFLDVSVRLRLDSLVNSSVLYLTRFCRAPLHATLKFKFQPLDFTLLIL